MELMRISVKVQPGAKHESIDKISEVEFRVKLKARAVEGKANEQLIEVLAQYFKIPQSAVQILRGAKSRKKILDIVTCSKKADL
jgi:uncharacterized protein (TIGR00251 family)